MSNYSNLKFRGFVVKKGLTYIVRLICSFKVVLSLYARMLLLGINVCKLKNKGKCCTKLF